MIDTFPSKPKYLFVCIGNSCRSQMSEGLARTLGKGTLEVHSAGSRPAGWVHPMAVAVMKEIGIDISGHTSKGLTEVPQVKYDVIVTMGCGDACPQVSAKKRVDWKIPDPVNSPIETFRNIRDLLRDKISRLLGTQESPGSAE